MVWSYQNTKTKLSINQHVVFAWRMKMLSVWHETYQWGKQNYTEQHCSLNT